MSIMMPEAPMTVGFILNIAAKVTSNRDIIQRVSHWAMRPIEQLTLEEKRDLFGVLGSDVNIWRFVLSRARRHFVDALPPEAVPEQPEDYPPAGYETVDPRAVPFLILYPDDEERAHAVYRVYPDDAESVWMACGTASVPQRLSPREAFQHALNQPGFADAVSVIARAHPRWFVQHADAIVTLLYELYR